MRSIAAHVRFRSLMPRPLTFTPEIAATIIYVASRAPLRHCAKAAAIPWRRSAAGFRAARIGSRRSPPATELDKAGRRHRAGVPARALKATERRTDGFAFDTPRWRASRRRSERLKPAAACAGHCRGEAAPRVRTLTA